MDRHHLVIAALLLAAALPAVAQGEHERFMDRQQVIEQSMQLGLHAFDAAQTCYHLSHGWHEDMLPTQSCAGVVGWMAAETVGAPAVTYLFHRTGHHRLERIVPFAFSVGSGIGVAYTFWPKKTR